MEDERRLFYVAATRAKSTLVLSFFEKYNVKKASISCFLREVLEDNPRNLEILRAGDFKTAEELITEKILTGAIFNTERMEDLRGLYFILTREDVTDLRLYQITPQAVVRWIEFLGVYA